MQPNLAGQLWAASPAQTGRDFERAREGSKEFAAAWKITELPEGRPGNKGLCARMHRAGCGLLFLYCLTLFGGFSV